MYSASSTCKWSVLRALANIEKRPGVKVEAHSGELNKCSAMALDVLVPRLSCWEALVHKLRRKDGGTCCRILSANL